MTSPDEVALFRRLSEVPDFPAPPTQLYNWGQPDLYEPGRGNQQLQQRRNAELLDYVRAAWTNTVKAALRSRNIYDESRVDIIKRWIGSARFGQPEVPSEILALAWAPPPVPAPKCSFCDCDGESVANA